MATKKEEKIVLADFDLPKMTMDMYLQSERLKTFKDWPFYDNCNCTAEMMAEAGFYHTPSSNEPDLVTCYVCYKEMDGWEPSDDPWVEHKNHSSKCPFVTMGKRQKEWTVEDIIKMEIKRREYGITKVVETVIAKMESDAQTIVDELEGLLES